MCEDRHVNGGKTIKLWQNQQKMLEGSREERERSCAFRGPRERMAQCHGPQPDATQMEVQELQFQ